MDDYSDKPLHAILNNNPVNEQNMDIMMYVSSIACIVFGTFSYYFVRTVQHLIDLTSAYAPDAVIAVGDQYIRRNLAKKMFNATATSSTRGDITSRLYLFFVLRDPPFASKYGGIRRGADIAIKKWAGGAGFGVVKINVGGELYQAEISQ